MQDSRKWWALAAVGSGTLMSTIDGSIVNIALNTLVSDLNTSFSAVEWVVLAYLLTLTGLMLSMGRLGDLIGRRRVYIAGFGIFTVASLLCGLAPNVAALIAFRVLQGIGAAMIQAIGPGLLVSAFPASQRGTALGSIGSIVALGILTGPVLGGFLLSYASWPFIFYVNIPIGILGIWLAFNSLPADTPRRSVPGFDIPGSLLLLCGLLGLLLGLTEGPKWGWTDPRTLGLLLAALLSGLLFVWWEQRNPRPMINLQIFRRAAFSYSLLAGLITFLALSFNLLLTPFYLQLVLGFDQQLTGLTLTSLPLALSLVSPLSGRLSDRIGPRLLTISGLLLCAAALGLLGTIQIESPLLQLIAALVLLGIGVGLFQSPNNSVVMGNAPPEALGVSGGLLAIVRTLGQTAGLAIAGAIWASQVTALAGDPALTITAAPPAVLASAYDRAMLVAAGIALLAILPSLLSGRAVARGTHETQPAAHD